MKTCTEIEEHIERYIDGEAELSDEVKIHLLKCSRCREYKESLESLSVVLDSMELPPEPPTLVDDVMKYIHQREQQRAFHLFIPGLSPLISAWKTLLAYLSILRIPVIFQREAWPLIFASLVVIWGVLIGPSVEAGKQESTLIRSVTAVADKVRFESKKLSETINSFFIGEKEINIPGNIEQQYKQKNLEEKQINMIQENHIYFG